VSDGAPDRHDAAAPLQVHAVWRGGYAAEVHARGHRIAVDEPVEGGDSGPMPTELLCASLASCLCLAIGHVAAKRGVDVPGLRVDVRAERDGRALRYGRLVVTASSSLPEDELAPLVERAERFCWVSNTLAAPPVIELSIHHATPTTEVQ
jgi:uncharacterized OsmC-like protein